MNYCHVKARPASDKERWAPVGGFAFYDYDRALAQCPGDCLTTSVKFVARQIRKPVREIIAQFGLKESLRK